MLGITGGMVGPYRIAGPLGAGGMGEVYRARDTRLGRDVAIKILPEEFAADPERLRRFEREARSTAALNHPNILAIHDVGVHEGQPYIVEELLEGESLKERLAGGPLPPRKAVEVAVGIARGLAAAHGKGIVHRDLKPANVFLTRDGQVKILDFGIAKLAPARTREELGKAATVVDATAAGAVLGTVGYMSPEQVRGDSVDQRSDLFSFGCVLYEMVGGRSPFIRDTAAETMAAILKDEPQALPALSPALPPALVRLIAHCLEKNPDERAHSAHDLTFQLGSIDAETEVETASSRRRPWQGRRALALGLTGLALLGGAAVVAQRLRRAKPVAASTASRAPRIVVLPFENLGPPEDAYFAAGMSEEITSRLANVRGLGVISRTSAVEYDQKGKTIKQVGADLGADYVLEGSVRFEHGAGHESRVRITPQLIRVADDTHVWADRYDRELADVFAIQSEVARNAVQAMGVALLPHEQSALSQTSTDDLEAYDLYLRGLDFDRLGSERSYQESALRMYQAAVDRDPRFAQAFSRLTRSQLAMYWFYFDRSEEHIRRAKEAAERAVELRPDLAEAHAALGWYFYQGLLDYPRGREEFAAALEIQPNLTDALLGTAAIARRQGRWQEAVQALERAVEFDPRDAALLYELGRTDVLDRRYADADRAYERATSLSPESPTAYVHRAWLQVLWRGDMAGARKLLAQMRGVLEDADNRRMSAFDIPLLGHDYSIATKDSEAQAGGAFDGQVQYSPVALLRGEVQALTGLSGEAQRSFEAARHALEERVAQAPDDARLHSSLGIAYAGLGRRADAVREARRGCDLMPASTDAWRAPYRLEDLALVFVMVGQASEAIAALDDLLGRSGEFTAHLLRLDPRWDLLRSDPRFQALLKKYEMRD